MIIKINNNKNKRENKLDIVGKEKNSVK